MIEIRDIVQADSAAFAELMIQLARESQNTLLTPAEAERAAPAQAERTRELIASPQQMVLLALNNEIPVGFIGLTRGALEKNAHVCSLAMGVLAAFQHQGIGRLLLREGLAWAKRHGIRRVELGVMTENARAIRLYEQFGFVLEGTRRSALRLDDGYADEHCMAKFID